MPVKIDFLANVVGLLRGTKDMEAALEEVGSSLDDVARDAQRDAAKIEGEFDDAARRIRSDNDTLEDSFKRTWKRAGDAAEQAGDKQRRESKQTTSAARADLEELGNEARQNAAETFSSFDGSAQSFVDGLQGTLGGIVSSLGPGGAIAGALGAIGLGFAVNQLTVSEEAKQEFRESVAEMTNEYIEWGDSGSRAASSILDQLKAIAQETDRGKTNLADWEKLSGQIGEETKDIASAYLNGGPALDRIIDKTNEALTAERRRAEEITGSAGLIDAASSDRITNLEEESRLLQEQRDRIQQAQEAHLLYLEAGATEYEARVARIDAVNTAYDESAAAVEDFINEETGVFDTGAYIKSMQDREQALKDLQQGLAESKLSDSAITFLNEQGADAAASFLAGYQKATPEQQAELNRIWSEAGKQNSAEYETTVNEQIGKMRIRGPKVKAEVEVPTDAEVSSLFAGVTATIRARVEPTPNLGRDVG